MDFFYVKIPWDRAMAAREQLVHERLESALLARGAGSLLGWGRSLAEAGRPAFHRIDIEVSAPQAARLLLHGALAELGVPFGTELHHTSAEGIALQDNYGPSGWSAPQPSTGSSLPPRRHLP